MARDKLLAAATRMREFIERKAAEGDVEALVIVRDLASDGCTVAQSVYEHAAEARIAA